VRQGRNVSNVNILNGGYIRTCGFFMGLRNCREDGRVAAGAMVMLSAGHPPRSTGKAPLCRDPHTPVIEQFAKPIAVERAISGEQVMGSDGGWLARGREAWPQASAECRHACFADIRFGKGS
jgi:hypothetical protein